MKTGIYRITNLVNRKIYIGSCSSEKGLIKRWQRHRSFLNNNKHCNPYLQNAWNKYGFDNFVFEVIMFSDPEKCLFFEQKCLDVYKPFYDTETGYNICKLAASCLGRTCSAETRRKIGFANKGEKHPMYGKKLTMTQKIKIGQNNPNKGKPCSNETKQKIGFAQLGEKNHMFGKKGVLNSKIKPVERIDIYSGEVKEYISIVEAEEDGFQQSNISKCCNNLRKLHKGFYWKYLENNK